MIIINNEELLRVKCVDVLPEEICELVRVLESELDNSNRLGREGIGLAAPQIGIAKNIAIVRVGPNLNINLINAKIEKGFDQTIFRSEGCLSFPGRIEDTLRYQEVYVKNSFSEPASFVATGLIAVVIQHEIDHLNGILLPDNALQKAPKIKPGPNEECYCGSKKKYKKCHGKA